MPPTLREVLSLTELGLLPRVNPPGALDRPVRWVAVSELAEPGRWLEGGELLLTTGLRLTGGRRTWDRYVRDLVAADVAAVGLGIGLTHDTSPPALVAAAERAGLPVLEVSPEVPFIAVSKAVSRLLAAEEYEEAARGFTAQRDLIRAALAPPAGGDPTGAVVARLARHLTGFVVVLDPAGRVVRADPPAAAEHAAWLAPEVARLVPRGLLASAVVATAEQHVVIQPLGVSGRARGFLAVGAVRPLPPADQAVVNLAVSLLSLGLGRPVMGGTADEALRAVAVDRLLRDGPAALPVDALGWAAVTSSLVTILLASPSTGTTPPGAAPTRTGGRGSGPPGAATADLVGRLIDLAGSAPVAGGFGLPALGLPATGLPATGLPPGSAVAVVPADRAREIAEELVAAPRAVASAVGLSDRFDLSDPSARARAMAGAADALAAAAAGGPGARVLAHADVAGTRLAGLLEPPAARAWAVATLAPLRAAGEQADLVATLRAWLRHHGHVESAAGELGVHRHTVRHRVRRAEVLLGRSLDDPGARAELWIALTLVASPDGPVHPG